MARTWLGVFALSLLGGGCAAPRQSQVVESARPPSAPPQVERATNDSEAKTVQLTADTELQLSSGATLTGAKGWFVTTARDSLKLEEPDRELSVVFVESTAPNAAVALVESWHLAQPSFARKVEQSVSPPPRDGWDEVVQNVYATGNEEGRSVVALARRRGARWYVALLDGKNAAFDRRGAQLTTAVMSLKPKGVEKESLKGRRANALDAERLKAFESFVEQAMVTARVPGVAVAVVRDGKVVFEKGFGVREVGQRAAVTPKTLFMVGSTSKSLTTLLMARLVDEGKLSWTTPITQLLPTFALADLDATRQLTVANTVCACAGLPRQDFEFLFEYAGVTPEMRVESMKTMKPTTGFGETFQYSNSMVSVGGYAAAHALDPKSSLGSAYDVAMKSRVFGPLGMKSTTLDFAAVLKAEHASPHAETITLEYVRLPLSDEQALVSVRPAGAIWSNASDIARYVLTELGSGVTPEGSRVVSEGALLERRQPHVKITDDLSYGLGLFVENDHGVQVVHHGGNTLGFTSDMFFLPEHGVGAVVLTNAAGANIFRKAVRRRLLELLFDAHPEAAENLEFSVNKVRELASKELEKVELSPDKNWVASVAGVYQNSRLGQIRLRNDGVLDAGEWQSTFGKKSEADAIVKVVLTGASLAGLELVLGNHDAHPTLTLDAGQQKYVFEQR